MAQTKLIKKLRLDMQGIPKEDMKDAKTAIGEYVLNETIRHLSQGKSPVKGLHKFKILSKQYAKDEKQGNRTPNINLEGDQIEALDFKVKSYGLDFGIVNKNKAENDKADGHNQFSSKAKSWAHRTHFPKRRYIPDVKQAYKPSIQSGINKILSDYRVKEPEVEIEEDFSNEEQGTQITIADILGAL